MLDHQSAEQCFFCERAAELVVRRRVARQQPPILAKQDDLAARAEIDGLVETPEIIQVDPGHCHTLETPAGVIDAAAQRDSPVCRRFPGKCLRNEQSRIDRLPVRQEKRLQRDPLARQRSLTASSNYAAVATRKKQILEMGGHSQATAQVLLTLAVVSA